MWYVCTAGMDLEDLFEEVVNAAYYFTDADRVTLYMVDEIEDTLWVAKSRGMDGTCPRLILVKLDIASVHLAFVITWQL